MNHPLSPIPRPRAAFTLLELMVSIALILVLVLGINQVFSLTSRTVGAGMAISEVHRNNRVGQATIYGDFRAAVPQATAPCFIIASERQYAYRNAADQKADIDQNVATAPLQDGTSAEGWAGVSGASVPQAIYNFRSHRMDRVGFFARDLFRRQTGSGSNFIDMDSNGKVTSSTEAWVVYEHLKLPDNSLTNFVVPGPAGGTQDTNPNNYYASQWILGRECILLVPSPTLSGQQFIKRGSGWSPLSVNSQAADGSLLQSSRYDQAETSVDGTTSFKDILTANTNTVSSNFWAAILSGFRYQGSSLFVRPLSPAGGAQVNPCFLGGCTQFMVEYAGDFFTQDNDPKSTTYGKILAAQPDGVTDFVVVGAAQRIRWYGFPRDADGDGTIGVNDIVPLRDVVASSGVTANPSYTFERFIDTTLPRQTNYGTSGAVSNTASYVAAWGQDNLDAPRPTMVRLTIALDDPSGRIAGEQTFEYVIDLP